jgi:hypothetical protein
MEIIIEICGIRTLYNRENGVDILVTLGSRTSSHTGWKKKMRPSQAPSSDTALNITVMFSIVI